MELKLYKRGVGASGKICINRTFMELKHIQLIIRDKQILRINRTFMELKPNKHGYIISMFWYQSNLYGIETI